MTSEDDDAALTYQAWIDRLRRRRAKGRKPEVLTLSWREACDLGFCDPSDTKDSIKAARRKMI